MADNERYFAIIVEFYNATHKQNSVVSISEIDEEELAFIFDIDHLGLVRPLLIRAIQKGVIDSRLAEVYGVSRTYVSSLRKELKVFSRDTKQA